MNSLVLFIVFIIISFVIGYTCSNYRNRKKLEVSRLRYLQNFVYLYCEKLQKRSNLMLEDLKSGILEDKEKNMLTHMLSVVSNIHDELVAIWDEGENRIVEQMRDECCDRKAFRLRLEKKMKNLIDFEDQLTAEDANKGIEIINISLELIDEIRSWIKIYLNNRDNLIINVAVETIKLLDAKEDALKMIENSLRKMLELLPRKLKRFLKSRQIKINDSLKQ